jgi:hypothetical protein
MLRHPRFLSTNKKVIEHSYESQKNLNDYIDCVIVATAVVLEDDLVIGDRWIHLFRDELEKNCSINT